MVTDATGEPIPDVTVTLDGAYETRTGEDGRYSFTGLPAAKYDLLFSHPGFQAWEMGGIPVQLGQAMRVDARLQVGTVSTMVTVEASPAMLETSSASMGSVVAHSAIGPTFTPHVRDYFPETLLWNPELVTDAQEVLRTLVFSERSIATNDGRWFTVRVMPYRTMDNRIDGVVITFADISAAKIVEAKLREKNSDLTTHSAKQGRALERAEERLEQTAGTASGTRTHKP